MQSLTWQPQTEIKLQILKKNRCGVGDSSTVVLRDGNTSSVLVSLSIHAALNSSWNDGGCANTCSFPLKLSCLTVFLSFSHLASTFWKSLFYHKIFLYWAQGSDIFSELSSICTITSIFIDWKSRLTAKHVPSNYKFPQSFPQMCCRALHLSGREQSTSPTWECVKQIFRGSFSAW